MSEYDGTMLKIAIENFIAEKRFMGYRYKNEEARISSFFKYITENRISDALSKESILSWADNAKGVRTRNLRLETP